MATEQNSERLKKGIKGLAISGMTGEIREKYENLIDESGDAFTAVQNVCNQLVDDCVRGLYKVSDDDKIKILENYQKRRLVNGEPAGFIPDDVTQLANVLGAVRAPGAADLIARIRMLDLNDDLMLKQPQNQEKNNKVIKYRNFINSYSSSQDQAKQHLDKFAECPIFDQYKSLLQQGAQSTVETSNEQSTDTNAPKPEKTSLLSRLLGPCARSIANIFRGVSKNNKVAPEPSPSRVQAAQSFARTTASFSRPLSNFSQYLKDRYEFGPHIATVLWRAKDAHAKDPEKAIISHVNEQSKKATDTRTPSRPDTAITNAALNLMSQNLGPGSGNFGPDLTDESIKEAGDKITLDDLRKELRELYKHGFETNKVEQDRYSSVSERDSEEEYRYSSLSSESNRRDTLSDLSKHIEEKTTDAKNQVDRLADKQDNENKDPNQGVEPSKPGSDSNNQ